MSLRNRLVLPVILSALAVLAGCGGGGSISNPTPPPSGGFTNSNFNGTYTFSIAGANGNGIFAMAGTLVACGCSSGTIASGTVDLNDPANGAIVAATIGNNSVYSITTDGRGTAQLFITPIGGSQTEIDLDFVLTSSSHGLVIRFDGNGTGSGTIDLQPSAVAQSDLSVTPYAYSLSGSDGSQDAVNAVGAMTLNSSGTISPGIQDFSFNGAVSAQASLSGSVTVGSGTGPGSATLGNTPFGSLTFSVYAVDSNHLKLIENDGVFTMIGDLFSQPSTSFPTGNLVFTMSGLDTSGLVFVTGGSMTSDGTTISNGSEDVNDEGIVDGGTSNPFAFTGFITPLGTGRYELDLTNYQGGSSFAAYPSTGGLLMMEIDNLGNLAAGSALTQQAGATLAASQGYGLSLFGEDDSQLPFSAFELDDVAEFKTTSTAMTGIMDINDGGQGSSNLRGTYSNGSGGFGFATFTDGGFGGMFYYAVDGSTALLISTDPTQSALGSIEIQSTPTSDAHFATAKAQVLPMHRVLPKFRPGTKRKGTVAFKKNR